MSSESHSSGRPSVCLYPFGGAVPGAVCHPSVPPLPFDSSGEGAEFDEKMRIKYQKTFFPPADGIAKITALSWSPNG